MRPRRVVKKRKPSELARHHKAVPFTCAGARWLAIEPNPMQSIPGHELIVVRCVGCGSVLDVWRVLPEPELVTDDEDDCA